MVALRGRAPPNDCLCPPKRSAPLREVSAPNKLIGSGLPECKSRPETCKIVLIASEFVENLTSIGIKTRTCGNFLTEDIFFLVFTFFVSWIDYIEDLGWNRLELRPSEMMEMMEDREVRRLNLELLPPQPSRKSGQ